MGVTPSTSVIDPRGRVWEAEGLYVADAVSVTGLVYARHALTDLILNDHFFSVDVPDRIRSKPHGMSISDHLFHR